MKLLKFDTLYPFEYINRVRWRILKDIQRISLLEYVMN